MKTASPARFHAMAVILRLFLAERPGALIGGAALAAATLATGIGLLGLSGWFITATALAGLSTATALAFDVFAPAAGIRLLAIIRTGARYGERLVTHDAALAVLAGRRERLFRGWAQPGAAGRLADRPARLLFRLTLDIDALDSLHLRVLAPVTAELVLLAALAALARLFLRGGPPWLLDEPTEGLDSATTGDVLARLADRAEGHSLVIATHLRREAELADRLAILADGRVKILARRGDPAFAAVLAALRPD